MLSMNLWLVFSLSVAFALVLSVLLALVLNSIFYDGSNNLLLLGAVVIPLVDAPIVTILLIIMIRELHGSRQQLEKRVKERTAELEISNNSLMQEIDSREKLQSQLAQAQKMESVGRLAGGVAHDYNNMLGIILGYTQLAMDNVPPSDPLYNDLQEILDAARRSSDITRKLLAFARKQTVEPRVLDLNEVLEGMLKMLKRLIGEDIKLIWLPKDGLQMINIDPSQIDQVLANLCVNARDAIADVGQITIKTDNVSFDETYCAEHVEYAPGEFVLLAVSDNGSGMDRETHEHIFEPFFTTKEVGEGTGLGLATVYGIVKQNNGFIIVNNGQGKGTTFNIFLPRYEGKADTPGVENTGAPTPQGCGETVLIVEDDHNVLMMVKRMLEHLGYRVLKAGSPSHAMRLADEHAGDIDLLLTDVIMPKMNGRDLANHLHGHYPDLSVLFMSGYTADVIAHRGVLDEGVNFIQKPFSPEALAIKVNTALGQNKAS